MNSLATDLSIVNEYREMEKRANIYDEVIKEHKLVMKKVGRDSEEYREIKDMIKFVKNMKDYKRTNRKLMLYAFAMSRI